MCGGPVETPVALGLASTLCQELPGPKDPYFLFGELFVHICASSSFPQLQLRFSLSSQVCSFSLFLFLALP